MRYLISRKRPAANTALVSQTSTLPMKACQALSSALDSGTTVAP
jgi:hypothetical protein